MDRGDASSSCAQRPVTLTPAAEVEARIAAFQQVLRDKGVEAALVAQNADLIRARYGALPRVVGAELDVLPQTLPPRVG